MVLKSDQQRVRALLTEAITVLCKNGLNYQTELCVEGLLGITMDTDNVFLINIKETFKNDLEGCKGMESSLNSQKHTDRRELQNNKSDKDSQETAEEYTTESPVYSNNSPEEAHAHTPNAPTCPDVSVRQSSLCKTGYKSHRRKRSGEHTAGPPQKQSAHWPDEEVKREEDIIIIKEECESDNDTTNNILFQDQDVGNIATAISFQDMGPASDQPGCSDWSQLPALPTSGQVLSTDTMTTATPSQRQNKATSSGHLTVPRGASYAANHYPYQQHHMGQQTRLYFIIGQCHQCRDLVNKYRKWVPPNYVPKKICRSSDRVALFRLRQRRILQETCPLCTAKLK